MTDRIKQQEAFDRIVALGGYAVWEPEMIFVFLENTNISDKDLEVFENFDFVQLLSLENTNVTDKCIPRLEKLLELEELVLCNTKITKNGLNRLRKSLPGTKIRTEPLPPDTINPFTGEPIGNA